MILKRLRRFRLIDWFAVLLSTLAIGVCLWSMRPDPTKRHLSKSRGTDAFVVPTSFGGLLALNSQDLGKVDIASMNLWCAQGLPGSENLNPALSLRTLDDWARRVRDNTERHLYRLSDPRYADHYHRSQAYFRCELMLQTLQEDCRVHYNSKLVDPRTGLSTEWPFVDSRDFFLHGIVGPDRAGSCSSMPVLYVAIGRRLGYPMKLVRTADHLFCRWDDPSGEQINVEGSGNGFSAFPDEYYKSWPRPLTDQQIRANGFLRSLDPAEELAVFIAMRGHCFTDTGRRSEAIAAYRQAQRLAPEVVPQALVFQAEVANAASAAALQAHRIASERLTEDILRRQSSFRPMGALGQN